MAKYVIDVQGFAIENSFIIKELSIVSLNSQNVFHFLAEPPFNKEILTNDEHEQVSWLQNHHHLIKWEDGVLEYFEIFENLREAIRDADVLYAKGREKATFIQKATGEFTIDLDQLDCPRADCLPKPKSSQTFWHALTTHIHHRIPTVNVHCIKP